MPQLSALRALAAALLVVPASLLAAGSHAEPGAAAGSHAEPSAAPAFDAWTDSARYEFEYRVDLAQIDADPGDRVRLWVPAPAEEPHQRVLALEVEAPVATRSASDAAGNRMIYAEWRGPAPDGALVLRARVERDVSRGQPRAAVSPDSPDDPRRHLGAARRVPLDGLIAQVAVQESRGLEDDASKIRAFYDYVVQNMRYAKHGKGWGEGDAIWACTEKYGNCTDFHSLFLGLARSQGIPARFQIGFPLPPESPAGEVAGYHCWAEAWDSARGWLPFDASEAWKARRFDDYFGTLPSDRIAFTTGRDLVLEPPQAGEPLNYFVYPYAEVDGEARAPKGRYSYRRVAADTARR